MNVDEVNLLLSAPMDNKLRAFFRAVYETFFRAQELLKCDIEDYDKKTGELICRHPKSKYSRKTKKTYTEPPKHMVLSKPTWLLFKKIIGNRKKGPIFIRNRKGERINVSYFQIKINEIATMLGIQKVKHVTPTGKKYHLVTLQGLREAGERHMDLKGADTDVTAKAAQHSAVVKEKYYKKASWDEIQEQVRKFHPSFQED